LIHFYKRIIKTIMRSYDAFWALPQQSIFCVLGGFILCLSFASDFSYSNLNTYITSYMRTTSYEENGEQVLYNPSLTYADFVFITTTKTLLQGASMPFLGALARKMGVRISIFLGSMVYSGGFLLTALSVQYYYPLVVCTMSLHGLGFSLVYATAIGAAQKWFPPRMKGFVGSLVLSGYGFGSLIWIPVQTAYVNPNNVKATIDVNCEYIGTEQQDSCDKYFTDPAVIGHVPSMFLILGGVFAVMGLLATLLISAPPTNYTECAFEMVDGKKEIKKILEVKEVELMKETKEIKEDGSDTMSTDRFSLTPFQVLKTSSFYITWLGFFNITLTSGILQNYSKTFGFTFINDDHYYAKIGIISNIFNGLCRIFWGLLYDRLGFRGCYLMLGVIVTCVTGVLPFIPYLAHESLEAKVVYGICMSLLYTAFPGIYAIIAAAINDAFGHDHYQANFGLLFTQSLAYSAVILIFTKIPVVYSFLGYSGMFICAAVVGVVGCVAVAFLPKHLDSEKYRTKFS